MKKLMGPDLTEVVRFVQEGNAGIALTDLFPGKLIQELCSPSSEQIGNVTSLMRLCGILMQAIKTASLPFCTCQGLKAANGINSSTELVD